MQEFCGSAESIGLNLATVSLSVLLTDCLHPAESPSIRLSQTQIPQPISHNSGFPRNGRVRETTPAMFAASAIQGVARHPPPPIELR